MRSAATPPEHGGNIEKAVARYRIPASAWLDLSAAINPEPYVPPSLPEAAFQHLPANDNFLLEAAARYYLGDSARGTSALVAAPGSQALIQWLPLLRVPCRVAVPAVGYREHAFRWRWAGHEVIEYDPRSNEIDRLLDTVDVLVIINPNNPLTTTYAPAQLLQWLSLLQQRGGWLVVDEAFIDAEPAHSMACSVGMPGLIVLRSLGKFFGLAGLRCGFALCEPVLAEALRVAIGPWPVSGPTALVAEQALRDCDWQSRARTRLHEHSSACAQLLGESFGHSCVQQTGLFVSVTLPVKSALDIQDTLAQSGIWVRHIDLDGTLALLRFSVLAKGSADWSRLSAALLRL